MHCDINGPSWSPMIYSAYVRPQKLGNPQISPAARVSIPNNDSDSPRAH